jgi:anti-sigma B factor antagonist
VSGSQLLELAAQWRQDGRVMVEAAGDLDATHAHRLYDAVVGLDLHVGQHLDLHLEGVTFLDTVGASVLAATRQHAVDRGCVFSISAPSLQCRAVLELVGLGRLLPSLDDSLEALPGMLPLT